MSVSIVLVCFVAASIQVLVPRGEAAGFLERYRRAVNLSDAVLKPNTNIDKVLSLDYSTLEKAPPQSVKLVKTTKDSEGFVVIKTDPASKEYRYACGDYFPQHPQAHVVCIKLGFSGSGQYVKTQNAASDEKTSRLDCQASTTDVARCSETAYCPTGNIVGIKCQPPNFRCDDGWKRFDDGCYLLDETRRTHDEATRYCKTVGARLAAFNNVDENNAISNYVLVERKAITIFWTAARWDNVVEMFKWQGYPHSVTAHNNRWFPGFTGQVDTVRPLPEKAAKACVAANRLYVSGGTEIVDVGYHFWDNLPCNVKLPTMCYRNSRIGRRIESDDQECYEGRGITYKGSSSRTKKGSVCMLWDSSPTINSRTYPNANLKHNYCRNPDGDRSPWCWVDVDWGVYGYCDLQECDRYTEAPPIRTTARSQTTDEKAGFGLPPCANDTDKFYCPNNPQFSRCLARAKVCDGTPDCNGYHDEEPEFCKDHVCSSSRFYCKFDVRCLDMRLVCDGYKDCSDGSDEVGCTDIFKEMSEKNFVNSASTTILREYWNLNADDCKAKCVSAIRVERAGCRGVNYQPASSSSSKCQLIRASDAEENIESSSDFTYYRMQSAYSKCINNGLLKCEGENSCYTPPQACDGRKDCVVKGSDEAKCSNATKANLRLRGGGDASYKGRVEVTMNGTWGTICSDDVNKPTANKLCKFMGFSGGNYKVFTHADKLFPMTGSGDSAKMIISNLTCKDTADRLEQCDFKTTTTYTCEPDNSKCSPQKIICKDINGVLGLDCFLSRSCKLSEFRCENRNCVPIADVCTGEDECGDNSDEKDCAKPFTVGFEPGTTGGIVSITMNGMKGRICDDSFEDASAKVICKELGKDSEHARTIPLEDKDKNPSHLYLLSNVRCRGDEPSLSECQLTKGDPICGMGEAVAINCTTLPIKPTERSAPEPSPGEIQCGERGTFRGARIVGGKQARVGQFPWQAGIRECQGADYCWHICGATIVSDRWIISASHCYEKSKETYRVRVGDFDNSEDVVEPDEQEFELDTLMKHPRFNPDTMDYDLTLLKIKPKNGKYIQFSKNVRPACIASKTLNYFPADSPYECFISGWGDTKVTYPNKLQFAKVPLIKFDTCDSWYGGLTKRMQCAGFENGGVDSCQGDSGGPLVCNVNGKFTILGATSWGTGCAERRKPGVYAKISEFRDWINLNTQL